MVQDVRERFERLAAQPEERMDLAEGALLIAAEEQPGVDVHAGLAALDALAERAAAGLPATGTVRQRLEALCDFLARQEGFQGNEADYYDPRNSYLDQVLARRVGIPITLALVYMEVGRRLGLAFEGVNFPGHFLVRYAEADAPEALYLDPFTGTVLTQDDCAVLLQRLAGAGTVLEEEHLRTATPRALLRRMLNNLKQIRLQQGDDRAALACSERMLLLVPDEPLELRERGLLFFRLECYAEAVADLERFLALVNHPDAERTVQPQLEQARQRSQRLN